MEIPLPIPLKVQNILDRHVRKLLA